jgi:hypothetical protein
MDVYLREGGEVGGRSRAWGLTRGPLLDISAFPNLYFFRNSQEIAPAHPPPPMFVFRNFTLIELIWLSVQISRQGKLEVWKEILQFVQFIIYVHDVSAQTAESISEFLAHIGNSLLINFDRLLQENSTNNFLYFLTGNGLFTFQAVSDTSAPVETLTFSENIEVIWQIFKKNNVHVTKFVEFLLSQFQKIRKIQQ